MSHDAGSIENEIYRAIRKVKPSLGQTPLTPDTRFESLGLESLERAIVIFEIEDAYEISIIDANLDTFRNVAEARDVVLSLLERKAERELRVSELA
ncbi:MAG TPA: acyl carrier protein [Thermoanaerobaculia bacterium]